MKRSCSLFVRKKSLSLVIPLLMAAQSQALQFDVGEVEVSLDSQFSIGSSWRVEGQDSALLNYADPSTSVTDGSTSDDGDRNYDSGDAFSQIFKGSHDLQLTYENYGAFIRGKYWYDSALKNNSVNHGHVATATDTGLYSGLNYTGGTLDDSGFNELSQASGIALLDAFIYGSFDVMDMPLDVRLGRQVVSWGESTFIGGGINSINPIDVSSFRRPGAEIKEGLLPVNMAYANIGLSDTINLEGFYQLEYQETVIDPCGTYFSTSDAAAEGCNSITINGGFLSTSRDSEDGIRLASDEGQFGLAVRYFSDALEMEFGLYAMNIHSRTPTYNTTVDTVDNADAITDAVSSGDYAIVEAIVTAGYVDAVGQATVDSGAVDSMITTDTQSTVVTAARTVSSTYFMEYPEDIQLVGLSFSGNISGVAISGEVSHKMDAPVQINSTLMTSITLANGVSSGNGDEVAAYSEIYGSATKGSDIQGYRLFDITQAQVTLINLWNQIAGASVVSLVGEVGVSYINDFDDVLRYGRSSTYGAAAFDSTDDGFTTETSWGYRARLGAKYSNLFAGIDVTPTLSFTHDVEGYSASPGGAFAEGQQTLGLSVEARYLETYSATLSYKQYMGGDYNTLNDRDYISASVDVQF